ncbi:MFS transporter [Sulfuracidifex metallicus]|uniref:MFS transporter n=1 Tax=Sulfuracidifex metallicus TaxID=47303 RepID=UPI002272DB8F|nr:MFS transporter [Sulfuracidifex metallicus]MCY0850247.1 MFS transporter [Sulfuracidifex metallicus]
MSDIKYDVLDNSKVASFHKRLTVLAALGPFTDAFNEFGASVSLIAVGVLFHLSALMLSIVTAGYWVGVAGGAVVGGLLSDKLGRKNLFVYDTIGMAVFALLSAASVDGISFFIFRFFLGAFIGIDYAAAVPLVSEYAPADTRGRLLSMEKVFFMLGTIATVGIGLGFTTLVGTYLAWRLDFIIAAIPPIALFLLRRKMPESIRWAVERGDKKRIEKIIQGLRNCGLAPEINLDAVTPKGYSTIQSVKTFFSKTYKRQVAYIFWIGAAYALIINLVSVYSSKFLSDLGASSTDSLLGTLTIDVLGTLGVLLTVFTADKIGRRMLGTLGFGLTAIPSLILLIAYVNHFLSIPLVIGMFSLFFFINVGLVGTLQYVPAAEVFPTNLRGLSVGWEKLFEFGLALPSLALYAVLGIEDTFIYETAMCVIAAVVYYFLSFETKQMTLEQIQDRYTSGGEISYASDFDVKKQSELKGPRSFSNELDKDDDGDRINR